MCVLYLHLGTAVSPSHAPPLILAQPKCNVTHMTKCNVTHNVTPPPPAQRLRMQQQDNAEVQSALGMSERIVARNREDFGAEQNRLTQFKDEVGLTPPPPSCPCSKPCLPVQG